MIVKLTGGWGGGNVLYTSLRGTFTRAGEKRFAQAMADKYLNTEAAHVSITGNCHMCFQPAVDHAFFTELRLYYIRGRYLYSSALRAERRNNSFSLRSNAPKHSWAELRKLSAHLRADPKYDCMVQKVCRMASELNHSAARFLRFDVFVDRRDPAVWYLNEVESLGADLLPPDPEADLRISDIRALYWGQLLDW